MGGCVGDDTIGSMTEAKGVGEVRARVRARASNHWLNLVFGINSIKI